MTISKLLLGVALGAVLLVWPPAGAQAFDPAAGPAAGPEVAAALAERLERRASALDQLFATLSRTKDADAAARADRAIWQIWTTYPGPDAVAELAFNRGMRAFTRRRMPQAEEWFDQAISSDPGFAEAWNKRATVRFAQGDYEGAVADIAQVLALEPRHYGALSGLGMTLMRLDQKPEALDAFEAAQALNPYIRGLDAVMQALREETRGDGI